MPRAPSFRIAGIAELFRQLRFAPREAQAREMDAAEALVDDIDPAQNYPEDYVTYRITGYRPDGGDEPVTFVGAALLADLVNLIQRLSDGLALPADYRGRRALTLGEVARKLKISSKTVQRYRRQGLVCHYVAFAEASKRLACFEDALDRFLAGHRAQVDRAGGFTRIEGAVEERIVEAARRLHETKRLSLNETARRIARGEGRAHETIRSLLQRHDRRARDTGRPIFTEHGPLTDRDARLIDRAWRRGVPTRVLAARYGKTPATIRRVGYRRRAQVLQGLAIEAVEMPTFELDDAEQVILSAPSVAAGLDDLLPTHDALAFIAAAAARPEPDETTEHALLAGYNLLKRRARADLVRLPAWPGPTAIDRIETDLRWATRLARRLVSLAMPSVVRRIEQNLHGALADEPSRRIVELVGLGRRVAAEVIETLDPGRGQRLSRVVTYAAERALAAAAADGDAARARRAAARHGTAPIPLDRLFAGLSPWEPLVELRADLVPRVEHLDPDQRRLVRRHRGLAGARPTSVVELAAHLDLSVAATRRRLLKAERALLAAR